MEDDQSDDVIKHKHIRWLPLEGNPEVNVEYL